MSKKAIKILESIFWLIISVFQITIHTIQMYNNGVIDWHIIFVIIFAVLFGCWLTLLVEYILDDNL